MKLFKRVMATMEYFKKGKGTCPNCNQYASGEICQVCGWPYNN